MLNWVLFLLNGNREKIHIDQLFHTKWIFFLEKVSKSQVEHINKKNLNLFLSAFYYNSKKMMMIKNI